MTSGLDLHTKNEDQRVRITARGLLDAYTGVHLREAISDALADDVHVVELDLGAITFIDSGGLRVLLDTADDLERRSGHLSLIDPSDTVVQVMQVTDLRARFGV